MCIQCVRVYRKRVSSPLLAYDTVYLLALKSGRHGRPSLVHGTEKKYEKN